MRERGFSLPSSHSHYNHKLELLQAREFWNHAPVSIPSVEIVMTTRPRKYLAYLLRIWQEHQNSKTVWRASLEEPHTGERHGFASLALLVDFLNGQLKENENGRPDE